MKFAPYFLPICTVATDVQAMCKCCGIEVLGEVQIFISLSLQTAWTNFNFLIKILAIICCDTDKESNHTPGEEQAP
jgi:hypothetical protein